MGRTGRTPSDLLREGPNVGPISGYYGEFLERLQRIRTIVLQALYESQRHMKDQYDKRVENRLPLREGIRMDQAYPTWQRYL